MNNPSFGPRTYLVGKVLPLCLAGIGDPRIADNKAAQLDEAIRLTLYIVDLTISRMGRSDGGDWNPQPTKDTTE